jgi:hypothetical protein
MMQMLPNGLELSGAARLRVHEIALRLRPLQRVVRWHRRFYPVAP